MLEKLSYGYRALGTGFCFAAFGVGCVLVGLSVFPVILFWPGDAAVRRRRVRRLIRISFRMLLGMIRGMGLGRVQVEGREWLKHASGRLVIATHPNYLDAVVLLSLLPMADCVVKSGLLRNPFTRAFVIAAGYISNRDPADLLDSCIKAVHSGQALVVFPEGTRTTPGEPLRFKRGAAQLAVRGKLEILPVVMHCSPPALLKTTKWYQVPERAWVLHVKFLPPCKPETFASWQALPAGVAVRRVTRGLQSFFQEQIAHYEHAY